MLKNPYQMLKVLFILSLGWIFLGCFLPCNDNSDCLFDTYCAKKDGNCDGIGKCTVKPEACTEEWAPVCGCDGKTYSNDCNAASAGVTVDYNGECRDKSCDDGTDPTCEMIPPVCSDHEILAVKNSCWVCVNPATCLPWGEPGCEKDVDCEAGLWCNPCGSSSCPACDDCVAACTEK